MKRKWYLQTWFIGVLLFLWPFVIPGIAGIILLVIHYWDERKRLAYMKELENSIQLTNDEKTAAINHAEQLEQKLRELGAKTYFEVKEKIENLSKQYNEMETEVNNEAQKNNEIIDRLHTEIANLEARNSSLEKQVGTN